MPASALPQALQTNTMLNRRMTIVKSYRAIRHHPLNAVDPEVASLLEQANRKFREASGARFQELTGSIKLLEVFCDITGQRITTETLKSPDIDKILQDFSAAMAGDLLDNSKKDGAEIRVRDLYKAWSYLPELVPSARQLEWSKASFTSCESICSRLSAATDYQRWYWEGWPLAGTGKQTMYLRLAQLAQLRGRDYVDGIYEKLRRHVRGQAGAAWTEWNHLFDYLTKTHALWSEEQFQTEEGVKSFMHEFTIAHFSRARRIGNDAKSQLKRWSRFVRSIEECLCRTGIWAPLTSPIKTPPAATKRPSESKTSERDNGLIVQEKLLTTIPLHVSDNEAMELLFFQIKDDLRTVKNWAHAQADNLIRRYRKRKSLAAEGRVIKDATGTKYKEYTLADLCATLEAPDSQVPPKFLCKVYEYHTGQKCKLKDLAFEFGFTTTGSLFPHQCLLVLEHPLITTEFLRDFNLYDDHDQLTGFNEASRLLIGYKNRKPSDVREQVVELTDSAFERVREIIEVTSDARNRLRDEGSSAYRLLFLTTGAGFAPPKQAQVTVWNDSKFNNASKLRDRLIAEFRPHTQLPDHELVKLLKKVRLTNIRSSSAVEIFIETKSTKVMSQALGHEHYYSDLLSHYLPEALLAFVKSRWIRIFQKSMVCLAMEESPYLLRATKFHDMAELHAFLEKHRIQEVPPQAKDPKRKADQPKENIKEAVLAISTGFLAALFSLEAAVKSATVRHKVNGTAEYWASIAEHIKIEIEQGYNRVLKRHLANALKLVDKNRMQNLIYAPTHWV